MRLEKSAGPWQRDYILFCILRAGGSHEGGAMQGNDVIRVTQRKIKCLECEEVTGGWKT